MNFKATSCPNCGAQYNPANYQCNYCGSYIFMSNDNYADFSNIKIELPKRKSETGKYPGIYVFGRLLGAGEKPITLGSANYFSGMFSSAGGKLLLTNKSLSFSAHSFNVGKQEACIDLKQITNVTVSANFLISQRILVTTNENKYKFVVYHGKEWVEKIKDAIEKYDESETIVSESQTNNYIQELQQLKQLLDMGIITEDEFNIKKRMLLGL